MSYGKIALIVREVEARHTAFAVARLIMLTGQDLRGYGNMTEDDPVVLEQLRESMKCVLMVAEVATVEAMLR